jgi:hypothetical protein
MKLKDSVLRSISTACGASVTRARRRSLLFGMLPAAALVLASCDPTLEYQYYKEGIGTEFTRADIASETALQDLYLSELCRQAGFLGSDGLCQPLGLNQNWGVIVEAGMNDIDERCDAYLAWLDDKRRSQGPILSEINALQTTSQAVMRAAGVGANPITIVGLAFGLASNTFTNIRSRLLLEADHSTVQSIVLGRQKTYREGLMKQSIVTRAEAVYALRSYLRICMPMTIEMQINTTVAVYEQTGTTGVAIKHANPLIDPRTVTKNAPLAPARVAQVPLTSGEKVGKPNRPPPTPIAGLSDIVTKDNPQLQSSSELQHLQTALCASKDDGVVGNLTKAQIKMFKLAKHAKDGPLDPTEVLDIRNSGPCDSPAKNYYEKIRFGPNGTAALKSLAADLDKFIQGDSLGTISGITDAVRAKVKAARTKLTNLTDYYGIDVSDQVTPDFVLQLSIAATKTP